MTQKQEVASILGLLVTLAACAGERAPRQDDEPAAPRARDAARPSAETSSRDAGEEPAQEAFDVSLQASKVQLCPGECADLTALTHHATGTVTLQWDGAAQAGASQQVCPLQSTTVSVEATDEGGRGEFSTMQTARARVTLTVDACTDRAVVCEWRHRFERRFDSDLAGSSKPFLILARDAKNSAIEAAPDGSGVLLGTFGQTLDLGAGMITNAAKIGGFVHRFGADCQPLKTFALRASMPTEAVLPGAIDVDGEGNIYVAYSTGPQFEYNPLTTLPFSFATALVIEKFAPDGTSLYRTSLPTAAGTFSDLEVDDQGELYAAGIAGSATSLGVGPIGLSPTAAHTFLLHLDAHGTFVSQRLDVGASQVELTQDAVIVNRDVYRSVESYESVTGVNLSQAERGMAGYARGDMRTLWDFALPVEQTWSFVTEGLRRGAATIRYLYVEPNTSFALRSLSLTQWGADGALQHETELHAFMPAAPGQRTTDPVINVQLKFLAEAPSQALFTAGGSERTVELAGVTLEVERRLNPGEAGIYSSPAAAQLIAKLDATQGIVWLRQEKWGRGDTIHGIAATLDGDVFVAGESYVTSRYSPTLPEVEVDLVIRKLRGQ